jgi:hypothetical protein
VNFSLFSNLCLCRTKLHNELKIEKRIAFLFALHIVVGFRLAIDFIRLRDNVIFIVLIGFCLFLSFFVWQQFSFCRKQKNQGTQPK